MIFRFTNIKFIYTLKSFFSLLFYFTIGEHYCFNTFILNRFSILIYFTSTWIRPSRKMVRYPCYF